MFFVAFELGTWSKDLNLNFKQGDCLFDAVGLTSNADLDIFGLCNWL